MLDRWNESPPQCVQLTDFCLRAETYLTEEKIRQR